MHGRDTVTAATRQNNGGLRMVRKMGASLLAVLVTQATVLAAQNGQVDTSWVWRTSTGDLRTRADLDSLLAKHQVWLSTNAGKGSQLNLSGGDLDGAALPGANLSRAILSNASFRDANLSGAILSGARLNQTSFAFANLSKADLSGTLLDGTNMAFADVRGSKWASALGKDVVLGGARLEGVDLGAVRWLRNVEWSAFSEGNNVINGAYYSSETKFPKGLTPPENLNSFKNKAETFVFERHPGVVLLIGLALSVLLIVVGTLAERSKEKAQEEKVASAEQSVSEAGTFGEHVERELRLIMERERLNMVRALSRSRWLFVIGTAMMVLSVFAPVASFFFYLGSQSSDWHLLAFGVAVGLLFLAAARGVSRQETHQRDTYLQLSQRVAAHERQVSALRIASRASQGDDIAVRKIGGRIVAELLRPDRAALPPGVAPSDGNDTGDFDSPLAQLVNTALDSGHRQ